MLFNSAEFIFVYLPLVLAGFFVFGRRSAGAALGFLVLASLVFYAWWRPINVAIIVPSMLVNYALARGLLRLRAQAGRERAARALLFAGIAFNVAFLGWFKYLAFFTTLLNDVAGAGLTVEQIVLPLGISFITFQKIAFLIDVHGGRVKAFGPRDYALFVLFFPQLIAGPIVHYREMMPQFAALDARPRAADLSVGLTLFVFGLFKKIVLADGIALHVAPTYAQAAGGAEVSLLPAWIAAVGFTLQIYFDFSGYSDMAIGLARCFGIKLPANFDSPLKARSIIDFWLRWHMTLTRFLTAYLYNPLVLALTRRRLARGKPPLGGKRVDPGAFVALLVLPTLLTMIVSGIWHGAGYTFVLWGAMHGVFLAVAHGWRMFGARRFPALARDTRATRLAGWLLTFVAVAAAMVVFRADRIGSAAELLQGMGGLNGLRLPQALFGPLSGAAAPLAPWLGASAELSAQALVAALAWIAALLAIALFAPNTLELLARHEPALLARAHRPAPGRLGHVLVWDATLAWALGVAVLAVAALVRLGGPSEFLYWQF